ncbi:DUF1501 domain-containing protein [Oceaniglobus roseus]|uniref:DUF1501 domain-containing protein n=1 Tax=Oceaniglobus roseus TaxID=1737570 RepID=UPI000C7F3EFE|nr:DUF1501 domain-containing protein [Kandeliimicrobium roseum]
MPKTLTRRGLLTRGAALIGCSAAASPLMTTVTFAAAPWDARLVTIILRGAMDGLDVVRPVGDPDYAAARAGLLKETAPGLPLDGFFELNPALSPLMPLWKAGQLGFVQAVSTPYRDKRSHFDGQDILEAGTGLDVPDHTRRDGWLNRMLQTQPGVESSTAYAIGSDEMKVLEGQAPVMNWSPNAELSVSPQARLLLNEIYHDDPLFRDSATEAIELAALRERDGAQLVGDAALPGGKLIPEEELAAFTAGRLREESRIAAFSINGWDTHRDQQKALPRTLNRLARTVLALRKGLGPVWERTTVLAMTEFGRTVRENGSGGTDHGTGGAMLLAGGAVRGGKVYGKWPGLSETALYERRDLMPTADVRAYAAWALHGNYGVSRSQLETEIFPGLDMGADPGLLL